MTLEREMAREDLTLRLVFEIEGIEDKNWVEMTAAWTRKEIKDLNTDTMIDVFDKWYPLKCTALHIVDADGNVIDDPKKVSWEAIDNVDQRVYGAMAGCMFTGLNKLFLLGQTSVKPSSDGTERRR